MKLYFGTKSARIRILFFATVMLVAVIAIVTTTVKTRAAELAWVGSATPGVSWRDTSAIPDAELPGKGCHMEQDLVLAGSSSPLWGCISYGSKVRLAYHYLFGDSYIAYRSDTKLYPISGTGTLQGVDVLSSTTTLIPGTDTAFYRDKIPQSGHYLAVYKNFSARLAKNTGSQSYTWNRASPDFELRDETGAYIPVQQAGYSENGKWIVIWSASKGIILVDVENSSALIVSKYGATGLGYDPLRDMRVSNDGKHIALAGGGTAFRVIDVVGSCGDHPTTAQASHPCPERELASVVRSKVPNVGDIIDYPHFSDDGGELSIRTRVSNSDGTNMFRIVTLTAPNYTPPPQLSYLALGDSYSSGEGDTEKNTAGKKYYRSYTDNEENLNAGVPREKCHVSTRSYPYILSQGMGLGNPLNNTATKWQSVACSDAHTYDVSFENSLMYKGQGKGGSEGGKSRLDGYSNWQTLKATALNEFIPGRQKQIEFVKKYRPKVITLTMGGNDVGFGKKLELCARSQFTCDIATETGKPGLAYEIDHQYENLRSLYSALYNASGQQSKIYVIGYPQFINKAQDGKCKSIFNLDSAERSMVYESVSYFNNVIEQAAKAAGVKYIDIEDSLEGGRLCDEGQAYMTAITNLIGLNGNERQESFHPNAKGNFEIAMAVWNNVRNESLVDHDFCPNTTESICPDTSATKANIEIPPYFQGSVPTQNSKYLNDLSPGDITVGAPLSIRREPYSLAPGSKAQLTLHSNPINLGEYTVAADGSLDIEAQIPSSVPVGFHTLVLDGQTYSGEPISYEQVVLVEGSDPQDIDANNIPDSQQPCGPFLIASGIDEDQDTIDDACDSEIDQPSEEPYRIRSGNTAKGEQPTYLYIERNINEAALTGVTGDADPDHDGWAVIATSQSTTQATPYAHFWIDGNDGSKLPHISFRTQENGCVQYKPANLARVQAGETTPRALKQELADTNTCRAEPATDDKDGNGLPDNTQPLYRARNGDPSRGESTGRVYLERSARAAEAQLGKSDYAPLDSSKLPSGTTTPSPTDTTDYRADWSLVASTQNFPNLSVGSFKRIMFIGSDPYVIVTPWPLIPSYCVVYKPQSLTTIKKSTQPTRPLDQDAMQTMLGLMWGVCK